MNNIIKTIQKNKRILIVVLVVLLVAAASLRYVLKNKNADYNQNTSNITDNKNNKNSDEKKKDNKQKETTSTKDEKKPSVKEDKKSDDKKSEEVKPDVTETSTSAENTTSNNVSNNTSSNKNTVSDNGCKTVYHEAVTHNVYHEAVTQQVWVVDTPAHDETTYTLVYYVQFSNGEKWYQDGSADFASRVADYTANNGLSYSVRAENQPNTVHYDEVGHYETQVVSPARTETVVDTPAYTTCE